MKYPNNVINFFLSQTRRELIITHEWYTIRTEISEDCRNTH